MSAFQWWRSWHGAPMDDKWPVIATRSGVKTGIVSAIAWELMDYASRNENRGSIEGFDPEVYAVYSGFSEAEIQAVIQAMIDKGIILDGRFVNWEKRQPKREDDSTERVRKFREMKRNETHGNAPEEEEDSERDTDTEGEGESARDPFDDFLKLIRSNGIEPNTQADVLEITKILNTGAILEDLREGIAWKVDHNDGKPIRFVSQLTGPTETARKRRLQKANGGKAEPPKPKQRIVLVDGHQVLEDIPEGEQA